MSPLFDQMPSARPMMDWLTSDGEVIVDHIAKLERVDDDMRVVADAIGIDSLTIPHMNRSKSSSTAAISEEDKSYLRDKYVVDFEYFDYA